MAVGPSTSTISVRDKLSGNLFLIDSGAEVSLPTAADQSQGDRGRPLTAVNGSTVKSYGQCTVTVQLLLQQRPKLKTIHRYQFRVKLPFRAAVTLLFYPLSKQFRTKLVSIDCQSFGFSGV